MADPPTCRDCGAKLVWAQPYKAGNPPIEADGSKHICGTVTTTQNPQVVAPVTIGKVVDEVTVLMDLFKELPDAKYESCMKYCISRMMRR